MNRERLEILRDYLLDLPEEVKGKARPQKFDMDSWQSRVAKTQEGWCRTSACALGHACYIPEFKKAGLSIGVRPAFDGAEQYEAGALFFDITFFQSEYLFQPDEYEQEEDEEGNLIPISPVRVAQRIAEILNEGKK